MQCASCGSDNPEGAKFRIECAAPLQKRCPSCGTENLPRAKFRAECASPLATQAQNLVSSSKFQVASFQPLTPSRQPPVAYTPRHLAERILAEQEALEARGSTDGERKTITALFGARVHMIVRQPYCYRSIPSAFRLALPSSTRLLASASVRISMFNANA